MFYVGQLTVIQACDQQKGEASIWGHCGRQKGIGKTVRAGPCDFLLSSQLQDEALKASLKLMKVTHQQRLKSTEVASLDSHVSAAQLVLGRELIQARSTEMVSQDRQGYFMTLSKNTAHIRGS